MGIEDEAQIGEADFNTLSYDSSARAVTIDCSIPVTLCFEVDALDVCVEETAEVLGSRATERSEVLTPWSATAARYYRRIRTRSAGP